MKKSCRLCNLKTDDVFDDKFSFCNIINQWLCKKCKCYVDKEFFKFKEKILENNECKADLHDKFTY